MQKTIQSFKVVSDVGDIPTGWQWLRCRYVFKEINRRSVDGSEDLLSVSEYYGVARRAEKIAEDDFLTHAETLEGYKIVEPGDLAMNIMLAWKRGLGISDLHGIISPAYSVFRLIDRDHSPRFFHYLLRTSLYTAEFRRHSTGIIDSRLRLYPNVFADIPILLPPPDVQSKIAAYLDAKETVFDKIIQQKKNKLSLLEEERLSVINQAVTKGLDPDAPMKDSNVEWIGKIPKHWDVKKLKFFADIRLGKMLTPEPKDGYSLKHYLRAYNVAWEKVIVEDINEMWFSPDEEKHLRLQKNDLIVSEGGEVGRCAIWNDELHECYIQNSVQIVRILKQNPKYYLYAFLSAGKKGYFDAIVSRVSIAHLTREKLKEVEFPQPPIPEQDHIRKYLDSEIERIDNTKAKINKEIELLQEYRTALISEAVTGKIDVREVKA